MKFFFLYMRDQIKKKQNIGDQIVKKIFFDMWNQIFKKFKKIWGQNFEKKNFLDFGGQIKEISFKILGTKFQKKILDFGGQFFLKVLKFRNKTVKKNTANMAPALFSTTLELLYIILY